MKKIVGIVVALAMLCTMASALGFGEGTGYNPETGKVVAIYTGLENGQATMLAYDVTNVKDATVDTAFVDTTTTPIIGIDQEAPDGTFEFPIPEGYTGKTILMVGGTDVDPIKVLLTIDDGEVDEITFLYGDIDGDGTVSSADGIAIINSTYGGTKVYGDFEIGKEVVSGVIYGDIDVDGTVSSADGIAIINSTYGGTKIYGNFEIGKNATVSAE